MVVAVVFAALAAATFAAERPAIADAPLSATSATQKAKQHYLKGEAYFKARDFSAAMGEYLSGYEEKPDPVFIFNVAQCQRLLGHPGPALHSYRRYLREAPEGAGRAIAENQVAELQRLVAPGDEADTGGQASAFAPLPPVSPEGTGGLLPVPRPVLPAAAEPDSAAVVPVAGPPDRAGATSGMSSLPLVAVPSLPSSATGVPSSASPSGLLMTDAVAESRPLYKKWWFWTAASTASLIAIIAIAASSSDRPSCETGRLCR